MRIIVPSEISTVTWIDWSQSIWYYMGSRYAMQLRNALVIHEHRQSHNKWLIFMVNDSEPYAQWSSPFNLPSTDHQFYQWVNISDDSGINIYPTSCTMKLLISPQLYNVIGKLTMTFLFAIKKKKINKTAISLLIKNNWKFVI